MCVLCGNPHHIAGVSDAAEPLDGPTSSAAVFSLTEIIAQLQTSWGGIAENNTYPFATNPIYYAALTSAPNDSSVENAGWVAMSALMAARAGEAFELWDDLIAANLNPYAGNPPADASIIQFAYSSQTDNDGTYTYQVYYAPPETPNSYGGNVYDITRAEVWLNSTWSTQSTSSVINQAGYAYYGGYGFMTYLHEIGHALGLSHPGSYDIGATYATDAEFQQDTRRYTLMSYFDAWEDGSGTDHYGSDGGWRYAQTPMLYDIAAVQAIYGSDFTTRSGNTTYGFNSNTGLDVFDFTRNTSPILTIWDGGGIDALDLSGFSGVQRIDLNAGTYSDVGGYMTNNLAIAFGVTIENAIGGAGNDAISGNDANNLLVGGAGNDFISGGNGNDVLRGGTGVDTLVGGSGADQFLFGAPSEGGDFIQDFASGIDLLTLSRAGFGLSGTGSLANAGISYVNGSAATSASPTLLMNGSDAYWDADGTGAGAPVFLAHIAGASAGHSTYGVPGSPVWSVIAIGDFNGNGVEDVLWRHVNGTTAAWTMSGGQVVATPSYGVTSGWDIVATGDFNNDGTDDILWRQANGTTAAWMMNNSVIASTPYFGSTSGWSVIASGDFNNDGTDDILWRHSNGTTAAWLMSNGQIASTPSYGSTSGWSVIAQGDFDHNGTTDILWRHANGTTAAWLMNNGATSSTPLYGSTAGWSVIGSGDFDGNGTTDLLWRDANGTTAAWLMNNGAISSTPYYGSTTGWTPAATGDFDGDGRDDILWQQPNGATLAWLMNGTFAATATYESTQGFSVVGTGDFGQGPADDLLWLRQSDGASGTWMFRGLTPQDWLVV
jgi:serralysin